MACSLLACVGTQLRAVSVAVQGKLQAKVLLHSSQLSLVCTALQASNKNADPCQAA